MTLFTKHCTLTFLTKNNLIPNSSFNILDSKYSVIQEKLSSLSFSIELNNFSLISSKNTFQQHLQGIGRVRKSTLCTMKCRYQDAHTDELNTWERQNLRKHYKTLTFRGRGTRFHYRWIMLKENVCMRISNFTLELNCWQCQHYTKNMIAALKNVNASINEGHSSYSMVHQI